MGGTHDFIEDAFDNLQKAEVPHICICETIPYSQSMRSFNISPDKVEWFRQILINTLDEIVEQGGINE